MKAKSIKIEGIEKTENILDYEEMKQNVLYLYTEKKHGKPHEFLMLRCPCGCENVTIISIHESETKQEKGWNYFYKNGLFNLNPSVQVFFPCKSHYVIVKGEIKLFN